jgi:hypothetical protein
MILTLLIVLLVLSLVGAPGPWWGAQAPYGWGPSGVLWALIVILLVLWALGRV